MQAVEKNIVDDHQPLAMEEVQELTAAQLENKKSKKARARKNKN